MSEYEDIRIVPGTLRQAKEFVGQEHRHHAPPVGHKFSLALVDSEEELRGVCVVGRPVARGSDDGLTAEVTRLATDGVRNGCSMLYGAAARVAKEMGYARIQTYILEDEPGSSLKGAGWVHDHTTSGGQWKYSGGKKRRSDQPTCPKHRYAVEFEGNQP